MRFTKWGRCGCRWAMLTAGLGWWTQQVGRQIDRDASCLHQVHDCVLDQPVAFKGPKAALSEDPGTWYVARCLASWQWGCMFVCHLLTVYTCS